MTHSVCRGGVRAYTCIYISNDKSSDFFAVLLVRSKTFQHPLQYIVYLSLRKLESISEILCPVIYTKRFPKDYKREFCICRSWNFFNAQMFGNYGELWPRVFSERAFVSNSPFRLPLVSINQRYIPKSESPSVQIQY